MNTDTRTPSATPGRRLLVRSQRIGFVGAVLMIPFALATGAGAMDSWNSFRPLVDNLKSAAGWVLFCLLFLCAMAAFLNSALKKRIFCEHALLLSQPRSAPRGIEYRDRVLLQLIVTRRFKYGIHSASTARFLLVDTNGARVEFETPFNEGGELTVVNDRDRLQCHDALASVCWHIAARISDTVMATILERGEVEWCGITLRAAGFSPGKGPLLSAQVPYSRVTGCVFKLDSLTLEHGEGIFAELHYNEPNFYPGLCAFERLIGATCGNTENGRAVLQSIAAERARCPALT